MLNQGSGFEAIGGSEYGFRTHDCDGETILRDRVDMEPLADGAEHAMGAGEEQRELEVSLLAALSAMALRSKRRQADLSAALRRAGLTASRDAVSAALRALQAAGCIENLVPLYDGGMIVSVTSRGIEHLNDGPCWTKMDLQRRA